MKCKICGGTGTSNTCVNGTFKPCTFCDGTGEYEPFDADIELDKLDSEPQTNEEWLHSLNTEQLAEWLTNVINTNPCGYLLFCDECSLNDKCKEDDYPTNTETWVEWLKQPHGRE